MTLAEIKAMFRPGTVWNAETPYTKTSGLRTVSRVGSKQIVWTTLQYCPLYMDIPTDAQIIEARDGFVRFYCFAQGELVSRRSNPIVTLIRQDGKEQGNFVTKRHFNYHGNEEK